MNTALIELSLSENKIGDEGAIAIAEALNITAVVTTAVMFLSLIHISEPTRPY